jgi:transposase
MTRNILNLSAYRVERVEETEHDYHIYAETVTPRLVCSCGSQNVQPWGSYEQLVRDLPMHAKRVGIYLQARRFRCNECEKTGTERLPGVAEKRTMTDRLVKWIGLQSLKRTFSSVAEDAGVTEGTVRNIFRDYAAELEREFKAETPRWLGIDEIHIIRQPRAVIANIESKTIVNVLRDRNKSTILAYLHALEGRERVQYVAMDMWAPYRAAVATMLPQATVVIDKFHVVRMANAAMESVRKSLRSRLTPKERRALMHDRFLTLKRGHQLSAQEAFLVDSWSKLHPEIGEAYRLKESFYLIYDAADRHEAADAYARWAASIPPSLRQHFAPITTAFKTWHEPIFNYFDHPITNAYTESLNSLIRVMHRAGRGYSFEVLRAKMLFTAGLHKWRTTRPKFARLREAKVLSAFEYGVPDDVNTNRREPPEAELQTLLGTDISTLTERIESGRF